MTDEKMALQHSGRIGTRKQSFGQSDRQIARDGLAAELAVAIAVCPGSVRKFMSLAEAGGNNRGRDLPPDLTGLDRPLEIKQTAYCSDTKGFLLVRPPRMTPGAMRLEYIDDSLYVLVWGVNDWFSLLGWCDRSHLVRHGRANPVPVRPGQRETWGIHHAQLRPICELADRIVRPPEPRRFAEAG